VRNKTWLVVLALLSMESFAGPGGSRSRVIDFEDEVVEGVNRKPLDSLNQVSERDKRKRRMHLYRKRSGFRNDNEELLSEMRYAQ
jgi:hypothetical protein